MNRFEKVVEILDNAVGGPSVSVSFHGPFWRGVSRNEFVAKIIFGLPLIMVGDGVGSNLVKALKGETPFGSDQENDDADFNRMPSGLDPVSAADIAFIQKWIDEGCLEDSLVSAVPLTWRKTNAPVASSRTDDIWFTDPKTRWAVNSDGNILKTTDGLVTWTNRLAGHEAEFPFGEWGWKSQFTNEYFHVAFKPMCIGMAHARIKGLLLEVREFYAKAND